MEVNHTVQYAFPFLFKEGYDPTTAEAELGLQGGMGLPAAFVNQQWTKTYKAIKEIQDIISVIDEQIKALNRRIEDLEKGGSS